MGSIRVGVCLLALASTALLACNADAVIPTGTGADLAMVAMPGEDLALAPPDASTVEDLAMCAAMPLGISPKGRPLDILFVVDNTASITIHRAIEQSFNPDLTKLLDAAGADYRMLVFSAFGDWTNQQLCLPPPATNNACFFSVRGPPKDGKRVFHYDLKVEPGRFDLLATYRKPDQWNLVPNGWGGWLRKDALKVMVFLSGTSLLGTSAALFDFNAQALDPAQFGNAKLRAYRTFFIGGMDTPPGGLGSNAPVSMAVCGAAATDAGIEDQNLSILTGGWRWSFCDPVDATFPLLVQKLRDMVLTPCQMVLEKPAMGHIDKDSLAIRYVPGMGQAVDLVQVQNAGACAATGFYFQGDDVVTCPAICNQIAADRAAQVTARACIGP